MTSSKSRSYDYAKVTSKIVLIFEMRKTNPKPTQPKPTETHFVILVADWSVNLGKKGRIKSSKMIRAAEL